MNSKKLNQLIDEYESKFAERWENESFKWKAIKCFQDNWDVDAPNFDEMIVNATKESGTLLVGPHFLPVGMICDFYRADKNTTRQMFVDLYDESQDLSIRISNFIKKSEEIRVKYDPGTWKNHFQTPAAISIYLWLKYPNSYFIFKPSVYVSLSKQVDVDYISGKGKSIEKLIACYDFYNEVCDYLSQRESLCKMLKERVTNNQAFYDDLYLRTLTSDFAFYITKQVESIDEDTVIKNDNSSNLFPSLELFSSILSKEEWVDFLTDDKKNYPETFQMLQYMYEMGGEASMLQLSERYGDTPDAYRNRGSSLAMRVKKKYSIPDFVDIDEQKYIFVIPFQGRSIDKNGSKLKQYVWVLRPELKEALEEVFEREGIIIMDNDVKLNFNHNTILYGPPGTGKTYRTAIYAVAICEGVPIEQIEKMDYSKVLDKFKLFKEQNRIAFTTFHQSYGYEEFIEGIRPVIESDTEEQGNVEYAIKSGLFKEFCERAAVTVSQKEDEEWGLNDNPAVWKVSLEKTGDNDTRRECMSNNHIRIGWDEYGEDYTKDSEHTSGKIVLNSFYNKMRKGDIVISCFSSEEIDAIGVVRGEPEWNESYHNFKRVRKVDWIAKGIKENIVKINSGKTMTLSTVYKTNISVDDILNIVRRNKKKKFDQIEKKNYVFIIDEINRGNISKILGELITLIEDSKRIGAKEAMTVKLPYSGDYFGVPDNVYIIGTMNTADRSIALMDTALRRRFKFIEMLPDSSVLSGLVIKEGQYELNIEKMLNTINTRIECLYDREHTIGHAFFTCFKNDVELNIENLASIFEESVIPLLQEYFYEDYEKIRLVLGDNAKKEEFQFIKEIPNDSKVFRGNVNDVDYVDYRYVLNEKALKDIRSYIEIIEEIKEPED